LFFAKMHSEFSYEVIKVLAFGEVAPFFWLGIVFTFVIPMTLIGIANEYRKYRYTWIASISALVGLWLIKHAWLIAPQTLPLS